MDYMTFQPILDVIARLMFYVSGITALGVIVCEVRFLIDRFR